MNFVSHNERSMANIPDQIDAKMVIYIRGKSPVAEFSLRIPKQDLAHGYFLDFETSTTAENGLHTVFEPILTEEERYEDLHFTFKIAIIYNGLSIEVLRLKKGKLLAGCWISFQFFFTNVWRNFPFLQTNKRIHYRRAPASKTHRQHCNVTGRKPGQDLPGSNPVVSHVFIVMILYRKANNYSLCFLSQKRTECGSHLKHQFNRSVWPSFHHHRCCPGFRRGFSPAECFPTFLPLKHAQKRRKSTNSRRPFSKTKERLRPLQATFNASCPRLSSLQMTGGSKWQLIAVGKRQRMPSLMNTRGTLMFSSPVSFFFPRFRSFALLVSFSLCAAQPFLSC